MLSRRDLGRALVASAALAALPGCARAPESAIPLPRPGEPNVVARLGRGQRMCWTVDDGADLATLEGYLSMMVDSGLSITFSPTHLFARNWETVAGRLQPLIESGQAQLINHTWSHRMLPTLSDTDVVAEVSRNENWIQQTFGVTTRPYLRPPNGRSDSRVRRLCGELGFTQIVLWDASLGDSAALSSAQLLGNVDRGFFAGAVLLGHANYPEVTRHFTEIREVVAQRNLVLVTLDQALGTTRVGG